MEDSIFTKIIKGEIPAQKIYEDDKTIAFLTIQPVREGHTLVVPKIQVDQYIDLPDEDYDALWRTVKKVAARLRDVSGRERIGIVIKGIDVPHTHVHLIPFNRDESLKADGKPEVVAPEVLAIVAEKLRMQ
jgi:histidine triad (HIT) family protein